MSPRLLLLLLAAALRPCSALVRLRASSFSFTFLDAPARFGEHRIPSRSVASPLNRPPLSNLHGAAGPRVGGDGICGSLRAADPAEACSPIKNGGGATGRGAFVLVARGNCSFEDKVRAAQQAGFAAAVVYDDEEKASLYSSECCHQALSLSLCLS